MSWRSVLRRNRPYSCLLAARFKVKNAYIDEVVQQSVKKSLACYRASYRDRIDWKSRRRSYSTFLTIYALPWLLRWKDAWFLDLTRLRTGAKLAKCRYNGQNVDNFRSFILLNHISSSNRKKPRDLADLIGHHGVEIIAIGNGTASVKPLWRNVKIFRKSAMLSSMKVVLRLFCQWTCPSGVSRLDCWKRLLFLSPVVCKIRLLNWSKSTLSQSVSANTSMMLAKRNCLKVWFLSIRWLTKSVSTIQPAQPFFSYVAGLNRNHLWK